MIEIKVLINRAIAKTAMFIVCQENLASLGKQILEHVPRKPCFNR